MYFRAPVFRSNGCLHIQRRNSLPQVWSTLVRPVPVPIQDRAANEAGIQLQIPAGVADLGTAPTLTWPQWPEPARPVHSGIETSTGSPVSCFSHTPSRSESRLRPK